MGRVERKTKFKRGKRIKKNLTGGWRRRREIQFSKEEEMTSLIHGRGNEMGRDQFGGTRNDGSTG